jgi:para-aminobenzoate synthetase component 2
MVLLIDNYDSFVYNLVQYLGELGEEPVVHRNDAITVDEIRQMAPSHIVISPGPCTPLEAGVSNDVIRALGGDIPILGVCLGHQAIGHVFGGRIVRAPRLMHGKTSMIHHDGRRVFAGVPSPFEATRYHSLVVERQTMPECLAITAETDMSEVMGVRHRELPIEGVQFHPEAILTEHGHQMLRNFLDQVA